MNEKSSFIENSSKREKLDECIIRRKVKIILSSEQRKQAEKLRAKGNAAFGGDCCLLGELRAAEAGVEAFALYCIPIPRKVADKIRRMLERERGKLAAKRTEGPPSGATHRD